MEADGSRISMLKQQLAEESNRTQDWSHGACKCGKTIQLHPDRDAETSWINCHELAHALSDSKRGSAKQVGLKFPKQLRFPSYASATAAPFFHHQSDAQDMKVHMAE
eukprot:5773948-Amphidinium_carterae.1